MAAVGLKVGSDSKWGKVEGICGLVVTTTYPVTILEKGKDPRRELVTVESRNESRVAYAGVNGHTVLVEDKPEQWEPLKATFAKGGDVEFFRTGISKEQRDAKVEEARRMKEMQQTAAAVREAAAGKGAGLEVIQGGQA